MQNNLVNNLSANAQSDRLDILARYFLTSNKLFESLRLEFIHFDASRAEIRIPFNGEFELASDEGLSTGILTTALDSIFGLVVLANLKQLAPVADDRPERRLHIDASPGRICHLPRRIRRIV